MWLNLKSAILGGSVCMCVFIVIWVLIRPDIAVMVDWALEKNKLLP